MGPLLVTRPRNLTCSNLTCPMMLSGNSFGPRAMDENSSALAAGPPRKSGGLRPQSNADDVRKQPLGGAAKPKYVRCSPTNVSAANPCVFTMHRTRRALGDLSSSQVNSRQVEKGVAGKPGAAFKIVGPSSKKESFQLFDGGTAAKTQSPAASAGTYYDEVSRDDV